jgi:alanyl-tRNA synthetase
MNSDQIRKTFLEYFRSCGYEKADSASLVPAGDQTLLFTNAGMVPFKPYYLGQKPPFAKACSSQKCLRAGGKHNDLEQVGLTARHHTFFEMLGNFVFSNADKSTAIREAWDLITNHYKLPKEKLYVTVYYEDKESREIWHKEIGLSHDRIIDCGVEDNFWSMGDIGPCGPCTEIFYDYGEDVPGGLPGSENGEGDRYVEIWNLVFMQYEMLADGSKRNLPSMGLDTGMGLERLTSILQNKQNNFDTDLFAPIIKKVQSIIQNIDVTSSRVIADHIRSAVFLISDEVYPSNEGRGYVLRRILRRALGFAYRAGYGDPFLHKLVNTVIQNMKSEYPKLEEKQVNIEKMVLDEEKKFILTISQGMGRMQTYIDSKKIIDGQIAFEMYDTYGFPLDLIRDIANKHNIILDEPGYHACMEKQRDRSRKNQDFDMKSQIDIDLESEFLGHTQTSLNSLIEGIIVNNKMVQTLDNEGIVVTSQTPFYAEAGGQIGDIGVIECSEGRFIVRDTQKINNAILHIGQMESGQFKLKDRVSLKVDENRLRIACNHSATHLLHAALRYILGTHVTQKGSLVDEKRLRFDFSHPKPLSVKEINDIENLVNEEILKNHPKISTSMSLKKAKEANIMALFDEKYEDPVNVVTFGEFSKELCGGVHVERSSEIGLFKIVSETGIASGVRRLEAATGLVAISEVMLQRKLLQSVSDSLKCDTSMVVKKTLKLVSDYKLALKQNELLEKELHSQRVKTWLSAVVNEDYPIIFQALGDVSSKSLRMIMDMLKSSLKSGLVVLQSKDMIMIGENGGQHSANMILKALIHECGGKGGGKTSLAQGILNKIITIEILKQHL